MRESTGQIAGFETGDYGRILSRNGAAFTYDGVGRRLDDDRFVYRWDWRGQLVSVTVKDTWPDSDGDGAPDVTPFAGHQVRYEYDAAGRLTHRWHSGKLPEGVSDDAQRPFIEKRVFVWEGSALAAEAAYNQDEALRWRKTYVPGPSGLDDAVQVVVEDAASATARTYTLLRDELGTVLGLVAEDEGSDPANPPVPVRYRYTPYGEAHAESGPELLRARFDGQAIEVQTASGTTTQAVSNATTAAAGSLVLDWSLSLDPATLPANLLVERLAPGTGWAAFSPEEMAVGPEPADGGISAGGGGPPARLLVLARNGWLRGTSYRVRLTSGLTDDLGRRFGRTETLEWRVPEAPASGPIPAITFDQKVAPRFETWEAATDTVTGRFPGGQTALFQGLWTDPVTGVAYARARWYDARNASWLSEDPLLDVDSPNLYAFVAHHPNLSTDPLGLREPTEADQAVIAELEGKIDRFDLVYEERGVAGTTLTEAEIVYPHWYDPSYAELQDRQQSYLATDDATYEQLRARLQRDLDTYESAVAEADDGGEIEYDSVAGSYYTQTEQERVHDERVAAGLQLAAIAIDVASAKGSRGGRGGGSLRVMARKGKRVSVRNRVAQASTTSGPQVGRKRGPSTDPNAPHNAKIRHVASQVNDGEVISGGGVHRERLIPTPGGYKEGRRPDVLVRRPDGSVYGINVGRVNKKGVREAIEDLEGAGLEMHFVPYNLGGSLVMAVIGLEFFAITEEWPDLLEVSDETAASWKTLVRTTPNLSLDTIPPQTPLAWSVDDVDRLYLTVGRPDLSAKSAHELLLLNPDALVVDVGRQEKDSLFASALSARTEDPESLKRWQAITRGLKKRLKSGLWVKNPETGAKSFSKSFWYTEGAGQFSLSGGGLRPVAGWNVLSVREPA